MNKPVLATLAISSRFVLRKPFQERRRFREKIWRFYRKYKRSLPWRETKEPYRVLISEIMLQQTQMPRVLSKYPDFLKVFPNFHQLNKATLAQVLAAWQGMGYNRRAKYLKQIARKVIKEFAGDLPLDPQILQTFSGIGKATAASIVVFAANQPLAFIETNIRRVFLHHFFPKKRNVSDQEVLQLVEATLDRDNPREWYWALMDYGTHLAKIAPNPNRRSRHYTKQSRFAGSLRQVRGEILRLLLEHHSLTSKQLTQLITGNRNHVEQALNQLQEEKMVEAKRGKFTLPSRL